MLNFLQRFRDDQSGSTAIEYGLLAALIAVVLVTALGTIGTKLSSTFTSVSGSLP
jgi:pilus assembly protein Flp/PilA